MNRPFSDRRLLAAPSDSRLRATRKDALLRERRAIRLFVIGLREVGR
jgi:hypothetical protein